MVQMVLKTEKVNVLFKWLSFCSIAGSILLTLAWIVFGLFMPPVHNEYGIIGGILGTISNPISGIGVGPYGIFYNLAFILSGVLIFIGILGVFLFLDKKSKKHWLMAALLLLSPIGFIIVGVVNLSVSVPLHMIGFFLGGGSLIVGGIIVGLYFRSFKNCKIYGNILIICAPVLLIFTIFSQATFDIELIATGGGIAGIPSRLNVLTGCFMHFIIGFMGIKQSKNNLEK
ncbi:hypothetical protein FACS1894151_01280 [Spirochaetia bacterium]|nr:hypothetical protein FACS1894151_01280 [Spirochaetia bacterium]